MIVSQLLVLWSGQEVPGPAADPSEVLAPIEQAPVPVVEPKPSMRVVPVAAPAVVLQNDASAAGDWSRLRGRRRFGRRLAGGGFAGFGAAYVGNFIAGVRSGEVGEDPTTMAGLFPVIGPFLLAGWTGPNTPGLKTFFVLDGVAQVGFLAMGITGVVIAKRSRRALAQPRFFGLNGQFEHRLDNDPDLRRRGRLGLGLALGGFIGFGVTYLSTVMTMLGPKDEGLLANEPNVQRPWVIAPLIGPFAIAGQAEAAGTKALMAVLGLVQVGSLATGITGAVIRVRRVRDAESRVLKNVSIAPWHSGTTTGLSLRGQF
jgi:hypothetical protein